MTRVPRVRKALPGRQAKQAGGYAQEYDVSDLAVQLRMADVVGTKGVSRLTAFEVTAWACGLRAIAEGLAQMPLQLKRATPEGTRVETDTPLARLIQRPNDWQSRHEFIETMALISALDGDFYAIKVRDSQGQVRELLPLPPGSTSVRRQGYRLLYTVGDGDRVVGEFGREDMLHVRGISLNSYQGLTPWVMSRQALALATSLEAQQARHASQGGRPSGILTSDTPLSPENAADVREKWNAAFGEGGQGGTAVLDFGMKFHAMSSTAVESQDIETRQHQVLEVARALRVFPQMLMASTGMTFASAEQFFRAHVLHTLGPWMSRIEGAMQRDLLRDDPGLYFDFDDRRMLRGDFKDQATYYATALGAGGVSPWMTQNEVRRELGLDPVSDPEADRLLPRLGGAAGVKPPAGQAGQPGTEP